jgi:hypothetical protein
MLHLVTVATHEERYLPVLEQQGKDKGMELTKLGMGKKYTGHFMKDLEMIDHLKKLNEEDIVIFADGFDTLLLGDKEEIVKKFKKFNTKMLLSVENIGYLNFIHSAVFQKVKGKFINTGLYMGYVGFIKKFLEDMYNQDFDLKSNQKTWSGYLERTGDYSQIALDINSEIFLNHSFTTTNSLILKNRRVIIKGKKPCFVQGNGCEDMTNIIKEAGYDRFDTNKKQRLIKSFKNSFLSLFYTYPIAGLYVLVLLCAIALFSIFLYKLQRIYTSKYHYIYF